MPRALTALVVTIVALFLIVNFHPSGSGGLGATRRPVRVQAQAAPAPKPAATSKTVTGDTVTTQYGPVQVAVKVTNGKVTGVRALQLPYDNPRSQEISNAAAPMLRTEALQAQSARIDVVSGASYTSEGYASSLQSALDKVHQS